MDESLGSFSIEIPETCSIPTMEEAVSLAAQIPGISGSQARLIFGYINDLKNLERFAYRIETYWNEKLRSILISGTFPIEVRIQGHSTKKQNPSRAEKELSLEFGYINRDFFNSKDLVFVRGSFLKILFLHNGFSVEDLKRLDVFPGYRPDAPAVRGFCNQVSEASESALS